MLNIFVNTWGNYNENGADGGKWITLPCEDINGALDSIAYDINDLDPEFFINDYEWTTDFDFREIGEMENIEELNDEITALTDLDIHEQELFCAAVEQWGYQYVNIDSIDEYVLYTDIHTDYDLGYYLVNDAGIYDLKQMGTLANYIDYEAFGRDVRFESDGGFTSLGWIEKC